MKLVVLEPLGIPDENLRALLTEALDAVGAQEDAATSANTTTAASGTSAATTTASTPAVELITYPTRAEDEETLIERSADADIIVVSNIKYPASVMRHNPNLKYICVAFTGYDHIDIAYCREHGIQVSNCAGYSTVAVADLVFALVISLYRNICTLNNIVREGGTKDGLVGPELEGKRFGIVGLGAIGSRVARIACAFGCDVVAYSRTPKTIEGVTMVSFEELLTTSDIVSIHVPQTPETINMIGAAELALMKPNALLINCARGPIVNSEALAQALNEGRIAGAGIDVLETEPPFPAEHPLLNSKNTIVTPHVAFASTQAMEKRAVIVANNVASYLAGETQNVVS